MTEHESTAERDAPQWQPLDAMQRRVLGVLIEKAKTTPDSYPLTINAIKTGSNQKSNRSPQMDLAADDIEATLDELRELGAVSEIQGDGRVSKYRHLAYNWLGVDKVELAVVAELLLRGAQTMGELRGRAARMEAISGLPELKPVVARLIEKKLVVSLTPEGRGQVVTHGIYPPDEMPTAESVAASVATPTKQTSKSSAAAEELQTLRQRVDDLEQRLQKMEERLDAGN